MLNNQEDSFTPTYLYIKQHKITGLKYFGKTIQDPLRYKGSGVFWTRHIKKHGKDQIDTIWCELFTNREDCVEFAEFFSEVADIVKSSEWANLITEDGIDGFGSEQSKSIQRARVINKSHHLLSGEIQRKYQNSLVVDNTHIWCSGDEQRKVQNAMVANGTHKFCDSALQRKISVASNKKRIDNGTHNAIAIYTCPYCGKIGKGFVMHRHHFDKCKDNAKQ